ncbi:trans-1,2-dihydrobenzene-1,2-diol dehydrogenase-like, partial [Asbolus verrucosus]
FVYISDYFLDIVYIGSLNPQHFEISKMMLEHGKHVLCEKPLTMNEKQTRQLIEIAKNKKLFLKEAVWSRSFPAYQELRKILDSGSIGEIVQVNVTFGFDLSNIDRLKFKEMGGGTILDLGVYVLQFQQLVFKGEPPTDVVAVGGLNKEGTDDYTSSIWTYSGDKIACLSTSAKAQCPNEAVIIGTKGIIRVPEFWCATKIETPEKTYEFELPKTTATFNFHKSVGLSYQAEHARQCIQAGYFMFSGKIESPNITHEESIQLAHHMDILRKQVGVVFPQDLDQICHDFVTAVQTYPESDHKIVAVGARNLNNAQQFAKDHNIPKAYEGYDGIAEDKDVDIVYVGNLNPQHFEVSKLMLENGKHVLCEKPLTMNAKQTRRLVELAHQKNLFLMEAVWSRCFLAYKEMKRLLDAGVIGDVLFASVHFGHALQHVERLKAVEQGGGAILDLGVYMLQFQQYVFRGLRPVKIAVNGQLNDQNTDESAAAIITYPNGKMAVVSTSARIALPNEGIVVEKTYEYELPKSPVPFLHKNSAGLAFEAEEARQCIKAGKIESPHMPHHESIELAQLMDLLRKEVGVVFPQDFE